MVRKLKGGRSDFQAEISLELQCKWSGRVGFMLSQAGLSSLNVRSISQCRGRVSYSFRPSSYIHDTTTEPVLHEASHPGLGLPQSVPLELTFNGGRFIHPLIQQTFAENVVCPGQGIRGKNKSQSLCPHGVHSLVMEIDRQRDEIERRVMDLKTEATQCACT